ncbi:MAG TPA: molybdenum cofactor guanylyltransferase [Kofleriaceae bacterium]|nr:molybdenum cofactor guanylyltransferase [Kofleriaceae bacterium]
MDATGSRAAILAGGLASRMGGRNKALIEVDGRAIVDRQLDALRPLFPPGALAAVLSAGAAAADAAPFAARGLDVVRDSAAGQGPMAGLAAALEWAGDALLFAVACDMPYLDRHVVDLIITRARSSRADIALPVAGSRHQPLLACYSPRCAALVARQLADGERRMSALPGAARAAGLAVDEIDEREIRTVDPDLRSFANINRVSDLA